MPGQTSFQLLAEALFVLWSNVQSLVKLFWWGVTFFSHLMFCCCNINIVIRANREWSAAELRTLAAIPTSSSCTFSLGLGTHSLVSVEKKSSFRGCTGATLPHSLDNWAMGVLHGNQSAPVTWCLPSQIYFFIVNPPKWRELNRPKQCTAGLYSPIAARLSTEFKLETFMLYNQDS